MAYQILVVDDEPSLRAMVTDLLQRQGYNVTQAASCAQARQAWADARPDAVLLDVMLPDGDGFSLLGELRRQGDIPVLFLSARDEDEARLRGLGLGADDYITKPFLPQELLLRLAAVLRRVYGAPAEEILCLGPLGLRPGGAARWHSVPHCQRIRFAEKIVGQPGQYRHHRRPVRRAVGGHAGGV